MAIALGAKLRSWVNFARNGWPLSSAETAQMSSILFSGIM